MSFRLNITIYASISNTTLNDASTTEYKEIKTGLQDYWSTELGNIFVSVNIVLISKGSLIIDHEVQTNTESTGKVVTAADNLVNGPSMVTIRNTPVSALSANMSTSGSNTVEIVKEPNSDVCTYYKILAPCTSLQTCKIVGGQPSCVNLEISQQDDLPLIMGVSIGGVLLVLTLALIFVLIAMKKRKKHKGELRSNSSSLADNGLGMGLKYKSCQGDHSYYAGDPDFYNPVFMGGDAWSETDNSQGHGHLRAMAGQSEFHIKRPQVDLHYHR